MDGMSISAEQIRAARERLHLTQKELADQVGVSSRTVGSWERGDTIPRNRMGALAEALGLEETEPEFGYEALLRRVGQLVKQRREELGFGRAAFAKHAGLGSDKTIQDFEFGRHLPLGNSLRRIEKALRWRSGCIDDVMRGTDRKASSIRMEDLDKYDSSPKERLAAFSTLELLDELRLRLENLQVFMGGMTPQAQELYGLAAMGHVPEHLEDELERDEDNEDDDA